MPINDTRYVQRGDWWGLGGVLAASSADLINKFIEELAALRDPAVPDGGAPFGQVSLPVPTERTFNAKVTGKDNSSPPKYSWERVVEPATDGSAGVGTGGHGAVASDTSATAAGGPLNGGFLPAYELNANPNVPTDGSAVAEMHLSWGGECLWFVWDASPQTASGTTNYPTGTGITINGGTGIGIGGPGIGIGIGGSIAFGGVSNQANSPGIFSPPYCTGSGKPAWTPQVGLYPFVWDPTTGIWWAWNGTAWVGVTLNSGGGGGGSVLNGLTTLMPSDTSITAAVPAFTATSLDVTLAAQGTYLFLCDVRGKINMSLGGGGLSAQLYDITAGAAVPSSKRMLEIWPAPTANQDYHANATISVIYTTGAPNTTINLEGARTGSGAFNSAGIVADSDSWGQTALTYVQIG